MLYIGCTYCGISRGSRKPWPSWKTCLNTQLTYWCRQIYNIYMAIYCTQSLNRVGYQLCKWMPYRKLCWISNPYTAQCCRTTLENVSVTQRNNRKDFSVSSTNLQHVQLQWFIHLFSLGASCLSVFPWHFLTVRWHFHIKVTRTQLYFTFLGDHQL